MAKKKPTKRKAATSIPAVQAQQIEQAIHVIRGERVMLDADLAGLYGVEVKALNQQVRRNMDRFPADFMFQLAEEEWAALRSQFVTLNAGRGRHRKYLPYAFTQNGVAMLSSVLRSPRAVQGNHACVCADAAVVGNARRIGPADCSVGRDRRSA
jgi:hypothetical protein